MLRQPIISVLGHVDHGKTTLLDQIRGTTLAKREAGLITQAIGATNIPLETIKKLSGHLLDALKIHLKIPGLLFIDTPGHAAFTSLRKRGGSLADIAILVIDINEGFKPQTIEAIEILKSKKTPFIVAANKIDLIKSFSHKKGTLLQVLESQSDSFKGELDTKLYKLVEQFYELFKINADRFDRIDDYSKKIAIIPVSAKEKIGLPELVMVLAGLTQKYLEKKLEVNVDGPAKGTVLEVKETTGLGTTIDVIIYDGTLKKEDVIVIATLEEPIVTKVRSLLLPAPSSELRDKKTKFTHIKEVFASTGIKISAPDLEKVLAGMPLRVANTNLEQIKKELKKEIEEIIIKTEKEGIIVKADTLGSLEALHNLLKEKNIKIRKATIGDITKNDIAEASSAENELNKVIIGFNVKAEEKTRDIKIITNDVIYKILDDYQSWYDGKLKELEKKGLESLTLPCKLHIMPGFIFRQNNPAVVGVEILAGKLKTNTQLMKGNKDICKIKSMQLEGENISEAKKGDQIAVSLPGMTVGRQIRENDILYSSITENEFRQFKNLKKYLSQDEIEVLREISEMKRKENPVWGI